MPMDELKASLLHLSCSLTATLTPPVADAMSHRFVRILRRSVLRVLYTWDSSTLYKNAYRLFVSVQPESWQRRRLMHRALAEVSRSGTDGLVIDFAGGRMILDLSRGSHDLDQYVEQQSLGEYEPSVSRLLKSLLKPGMIFLDCGANNGYYSLLASRWVGPGGIVFAFEPSPKTYSRLLRNVRLNQAENVRLFNCALGREDGVARLNLSDKSDGLNSLLKIEGASQRIVVPLRRIDDIIWEGGVDVVKMDVEGGERDILEGMRRVLALSRNPQVIMEHNYFVLGRTGSLRLFDTLRDLHLAVHEVLPSGVSRGTVDGPTGLLALSTTLYCHRHTREGAPQTGELGEGELVRTP